MGRREGGREGRSEQEEDLAPWAGSKIVCCQAVITAAMCCLPLRVQQPRLDCGSSWFPSWEVFASEERAHEEKLSEGHWEWRAGWRTAKKEALITT